MIRNSLFAIIFFLSAVSAFGRTEHVDSVRPKVETGVGAAISLGINAAVTEALKHSVHEMRPKGVGNTSFPSRHASWAFTVSTVFSNELYRESPFWSLGAQLAASSVGMQRVMSHHHYASDVIAGASIGIASTELAYFLTRKIFSRGSVMALPKVENRYGLSMAVRTEALYWLGRWNGMETCAGISTSIDVSVPVLEGKGGLGFSAKVMSTPVHVKAKEISSLDGIGLLAGWEMSFSLCTKSLAFRPSVKVGTIRMLTTKDLEYCIWGFDSALRGDFAWRMTPKFGLNLGVGGALTVIDRPIAGLTVSVASVAYF